MEEVAAIAATFLLLTVLVQLTMAMTARSTADAATAAAARRLSLGADPVVETDRLEAALSAMIPGAADIESTAVSTSTSVTVTATFRWVPPGPHFSPLTILTSAQVPRAVPP